MQLSTDETRALGFVAALLVLAAAARLHDRPPDPLPAGTPLDIAALEAASEQARATDERRRRPLEPGERLDPNTAPAEELERLPRVGRALAERIVAERERGGAFRSLADLRRVPGIGARTAEMLSPHLDLPAAAGSAGAWRSPLDPGAGPAERPARAGPAAPPPASPALDLNAATAPELERLPGVGPVLAARIVAYRDSLGGFRALEDLDAVPGIGPATLARLIPHLALGSR